jgi:hypothetical protein
MSFTIKDILEEHGDGIARKRTGTNQKRTPAGRAGGLTVDILALNGKLNDAAVPHGGRVFHADMETRIENHLPHLLRGVVGEAGVVARHDFVRVRILNQHVSSRTQNTLHIVKVGLNDRQFEVDEAAKAEDEIHRSVWDPWEIRARILDEAHVWPIEVASQLVQQFRIKVHDVERFERK